jgi:hypothetical protein
MNLVSTLNIYLTPPIWGGAAMVVIVWLLDLQLPVQSVPSTTEVVSVNPVHGEVYSIQHYDKVCHWLATVQWFSPGTPVCSTNTTDCHDIAEILLKVEISTINQRKQCLYWKKQMFSSTIKQRRLRWRSV